jgi:hypothetical protein
VVGDGVVFFSTVILGFQVTSCYFYSKIQYNEIFGISLIRGFPGYRLG